MDTSLINDAEADPQTRIRLYPIWEASPTDAATWGVSRLSEIAPPGQKWVLMDYRTTINNLRVPDDANRRRNLVATWMRYE